MSFQVTKVDPQGYCGGVRKAIAIALATRRQYPDQKITILGNLVHNSYVKKALQAYGLETVEDPGKNRLELLDKIDEGIVIFTAHGIGPRVRQKAAEKGLQIVDASCPFVLQTQKAVSQKIKEGYTVFYIGKKGHPEAEAVCALRPDIRLITKAQDIPASAAGPVFVTNQTTMSVLELQSLFEAIRSNYPDALFQNEICNATRIRQQAILDLAGQSVDCLIVVGDPTSNNTDKLAAIGRQAGIPKVLKIEDLQALHPEDLQGVRHIALTSGASTPPYLTGQVYDYLMHYPCKKQPVSLADILE